MAALGVIVAAIFREPIVMLWLGSILVAMTMTRVVAGLVVSRARRQGFEMYFKTNARRYTVTRLEQFALDIVLRNRSDVALRLRDFQVLASPEITMSASVEQAYLEAGSSIKFALHGAASRVGRHAVHGLSLRVVHSSGAFESPLIFVNPVQVVAYPAAVRQSVRASLGGLSRRPSDAERTGHMSGDSIELRELRAHQPGDGLRKIAWKASARRGNLLVRDEELMERQSLWVLLDASSELWAGEMGKAPLDEGIDQLASVLHKYIVLGDHVGLGVVAARVLAWIPPDTGAAHLARVNGALLKAAQQWDSDRSGSDELDVARIVLEHMIRLDGQLVRQVSSSQIEAIAQAANVIMKRFEHEVPEVFASTSRERTLRQYATAFGLTSPPRLELERRLCDSQLLTAIERCVADRPTRIVICSVEPNTRLLDGIVSLRRRLAHHRIKMSWLTIRSAAGLPSGDGLIQKVVNDAIMWRTSASTPKLMTRLKRLGINIEHTPRPKILRRPTESQ
jgi:uncharacterized protein (DUF58 family)